MRLLKELIDQLPPELQKEVQDFVEFLFEKKVAQSRGKDKNKLKLDWRGALRDLRDHYTSLELQRKLMEWRGD